MRFIVLSLVLLILLSSAVTATNTLHERLIGDEHAPVYVEQWCDFKSRWCENWYFDTFQDFVETYVDTGIAEFKFRYFPVSDDNYEVARGAECAALQGKFWDYHDKAYIWDYDVTVDAYDYASMAGADMSEFSHCMDQAATEDAVLAERSIGTSKGVTSTPTFFVNGEKVVGAKPLSVFDDLLEGYEGSGSGEDGYDLDVISISFDPEDPATHEIDDGKDLEIIVKYTLSNSQGVAYVDMDVDVYDTNGGFVEGCGSRKYDPESTGEVSCGVDDFDGPGEYKFIVTLDEDEVINDPDRSNNQEYVYVYVGDDSSQGGLPDLTIIDYDVNPALYEYRPYAYGDNTRWRIPLPAWRVSSSIKNIGDESVKIRGDYTAPVVGTRINGEVSGYRAMSGDPSIASTTLQVGEIGEHTKYLLNSNERRYIRRGENNIKIIADVNDDITELKENNNEVEFTYQDSTPCEYDGGSATLFGKTVSPFCISEDVEIQYYCEDESTVWYEEVANTACNDEPPIDEYYLGRYIFGDDDAPVHMVWYFEFEDPFSYRFYDESIEYLVDEYIGEGLVYLEVRHMPLGFHSNALDASVAAECAYQADGIDGFFDFFGNMFEDDAIDKLSEEYYFELAEDEGIDMVAFKECYEEYDTAAEVVQAHFDYATINDGASGVPTFVFNDGEARINGARPLEDFIETIEELLGNTNNPESFDVITVVGDDSPVEDVLAAIDISAAVQSYAPNVDIDVSNHLNSRVGIADLDNKLAVVFYYGEAFIIDGIGARNHHHFVDNLENYVDDVDYDYETIFLSQVDDDDLTLLFEGGIINPPTHCASGCALGTACIPVGTRIAKDGDFYCNFDGKLYLQQEIDTTCQNNYECRTNQCSSGSCVDLVGQLSETQDLLEKIINFFKGIFGPK